MTRAEREARRASDLVEKRAYAKNRREENLAQDRCVNDTKAPTHAPRRPGTLKCEACHAKHDSKKASSGS